MATFKAPGLDKYVAQLERLGKKTDTVISEAVYEMAKVVADEVRVRIETLPSVPDSEGLAAYQEKRKIPITKAQKWGLAHSFGVASIRNDGGFIHVKLGQLNYRLTNLGNGVCSLGYEMQGGIGQLGKEVALGQSNLQQTIMGTGNGIQQQISNCCCENRLATANLSAQMDRQTCDITTAIHAEGEQTRALMQANTIQQLRDKVNALELAGQMAGVVRYPTGYAYNAGPSPFCGGGCSCA